MPLLSYRFPRQGLHIHELGDFGLSEKQKQEYPTLKLREADYGREGITGLYYDEDLIAVAGVRIPFITYAKFDDIFSLELKVLEGHYERRFPVSVVDKKLEEAKINPNHTNGQVVSISDFRKLEDGTLELVGRQAGYFDLLVSNLSQDVDLSTLDKQFEQGQTFRRMEVRNGKKVPFKDSFLANTLGAGYLIRTGKDNLYIFGRRRKNLAVEGGTWSVIGTTPVWRDYFRGRKRENQRGNIEMGYTFLEYTMKEFEEELALCPWEIKFKTGWLVDELYRGPALFTIWETAIDMEEIVERCRKHENVKTREEHDYLMFAGTLTTDILSSFHQGISLENGEYVLHRPSQLLPTSATGVSLRGKFSLNEPSLAMIKLALNEFKK